MECVVRDIARDAWTVELWIDAFTKLRKGILTSSCLFAWNSLADSEGLREAVYCSIFRKSIQKIPLSFKSEQQTVTVH